MTAAPIEAIGLRGVIAVVNQLAENAQNAAGGIETDIAGLERHGVSGPAIASLKSAQEQFDAAADALWTGAGRLEEMLAVADAHDAVGGHAGSKEFLLADTSTPNAKRVYDAGMSSTVEDQIREAYSNLSAQSGSPWVGLAALRRQLPGIARDDLDETLRAMSRQPGHHLQEEANQQALTDEDWAAAVTFGGSTRHILNIEHTTSGSRRRH